MCGFEKPEIEAIEVTQGERVSGCGTSFKVEGLELGHWLVEGSCGGNCHVLVWRVLVVQKGQEFFVFG
jgi:hypothetical protein